MKPKPARRPAGLVAFCSRCSAAHMRGSPTVAVAVCTLNSERSPPSSCSRLPCHCHCHRHRHRLPVPTPAGHNLKLWILKPYGPRSSTTLPSSTSLISQPLVLCHQSSHSHRTQHSDPGRVCERPRTPPGHGMGDGLVLPRVWQAARRLLRLTKRSERLFVCCVSDGLRDSV